MRPSTKFDGTRPGGTPPREGTRDAKTLQGKELQGITPLGAPLLTPVTAGQIEGKKHRKPLQIASKTAEIEGETIDNGHYR